MLTKRSLPEKVFDTANVLFLTILSLVFIYPLLYCLFASVSDPARLNAHMGLLLHPLGFSLQAYQMVLGSGLIVRGLANTVLYVVAGTALSLLLTSFAGFVLSRKGFYWKKAIMFAIVFTMYFGGGLIPTYLVVKDVHLLDSPLAIIIPSAVNTFYVIIMRTYFMGIPDSLEESAYIDGANEFTILFRIILPISMPVVAVMVIYYGVGQWNNWFSSMIYLVYHQEWQPLQLILRNLLLQNDVSRLGRNLNQAQSHEYARLVKYSLIIVTVLPIIIIYPFLQKYFVSGVMIGSLKE